METNKKNGKAIASLVVSCISVLSCCSWYVSIIFGFAGVVLGLMAFRDEYAGQRDLAVAGIVVGAVGLTLGIASAVIYIYLAGMPASTTNNTTVSPSAITVPSPTPSAFPEGGGTTMFLRGFLGSWF